MAISRKIYIVMGYTHVSYEDEHNWLVRAFTNKKDATEHAEKAEKRAEEKYLKFKKTPPIQKYHYEINLSNHFDRKAHALDNHTPEYRVEVVVLEDN